MSGEIEATARGHLAADVEVRATPSGDEVAQLRLAVGVRRKNADGEWADVRTDWLDVSVWGALIGRVSHLKKGAHIEVRGSLRPEAYLGNDGEAKASTKLTARSVTLVPALARPVEAAA